MVDRILSAIRDIHEIEMTLDPDFGKVLKMISEEKEPNFRDMDVNDIRNSMGKNQFIGENIEIKGTTDIYQRDEKTRHTP